MRKGVSLARFTGWLVVIIISLLAAAVLFVLGFRVILRFALSRPQLIPGGTVTVMEDYNTIFFQYDGETELRMGPDFTFTNKSTGEVISVASSRDFADYDYDYNDPEHNYEEIMIYLATVELSPGDYLVEYKTEDDVDNPFYIGQDGFSIAFRGTMLFLAGALCVLPGIFAFIKHYDVCRRMSAQAAEPLTTERTEQP